MINHYNDIYDKEYETKMKDNMHQIALHNLTHNKICKMKKICF